MFGNFKAKGWKDIERTVLTLTFDHVTWKSIGFIYFLGSLTLSSLAIFEQSGQTTLNAQRTTRPNNRQVQNRIFQRWHKKQKTCSSTSLCLKKSNGVLFQKHLLINKAICPIKDKETKSYLDKMYTGKVQLPWSKSQVMTEPTSEVGGTKWGCKTRNTAGFG